MAAQDLPRRARRKRSAQEPPSEALAANATVATETPAKKARARSGAVKVRKPRAKKPPPRVRVRWGVFDGGMKQVAAYDYNQRADADAKLADLSAKKKGVYFLQLFKEPMPEPAAAAPETDVS